jgi:ABC-type glycerol-3-phosphate transport system substrate-binding protein
MKTKKVISMLLCLCTIGTTTACGITGSSGGNGNGKKMILNVINTMGGIGSVWLDDAIERYEELAQDKVYGEKIGVDVEYDIGVSPQQNISQTDASDIIVIEKIHLNDYVQKNLVLDLTDLYAKESAYGDAKLQDRILPSAKGNVVGMDGKYYGLPHYEYFSGLSYNKKLFDESGYYFALNEENGVYMSTDYGSAYFVKDANSQKSYGPDGKTGVENGVNYSADDGLPSTLEELIILCAQMMSEGVEPIQLSGQYINYSNALMNGLWSSLAGYDQIQTFYTYEGKVEAIQVVPGANLNESTLSYSNDNVFEGINYIKKPNTEWIDISLDNGYRVKDMAARYYAAAFLKIAEEEGFLSADSKINTVSHTGAQRNFLVGDKTGKGAKMGMLCENTYWWNEAIINDVDQDYEDLTGEDFDDLDIRFMPLPTYVNEEQKQASQRTDDTNVLVDTSYAVMLAQKHVEKDANRKQAVLDFLEFLYCEEELKNFTKSTGIGRGFNYSVSAENDLAPKGTFLSDLWDLRSRSKVLYHAADNKIFKAYGSSLTIAVWGETWRNGNADNFLVSYRDNGSAVADLIQMGRVSAATWANWKAELGI